MFLNFISKITKVYKLFCTCRCLAKLTTWRKPRMSTKIYDSLIRLLLVGDTGVGKTCLICRYAHDQFSNDHVSTIGKYY